VDGAPEGLAAIEIGFGGEHGPLCRGHTQERRGNGALNIEARHGFAGARAGHGGFRAGDGRFSQAEIERLP
jgi:hypothetical protein